jgi:inhibitor of cysteine peptidase
VTGRQFLSLARVIALVGISLMYAHDAVCYPNPEEGPQAMLLLVENDNGRTVDIRVGESVRITLSENATTGYRWAIDRYEEEFIEAVSTEPSNTANALGSGGEVAFIFKGKKIGTGEIILKHWRHWEGDSSVTTRFRIQLRVQP